MKRIDTKNREIDKFGPGKDGFRSAVPGVSEPTYLNAKFFNAIQEALVRVIESAGLVPADDHNQFLNALLAIADRTRTDLGAPNGSSLVGHTDALSGKVSSVKRKFDSLPEEYGRLDRSCLPVLMRAIRLYRLGDATQRKLRFAVFGSSVGNGPTLPSPATQAPGFDFVTRLMRALDPAGIYAYEVRNYSVDGSTVTEWNQPGGAIDVMTAQAFVPDVAYLIPGMNDFATAQYNSGQGFQGFQKEFAQILLRLKYRIGCDVVSTTSPHPSIVNYPDLNSLNQAIPQVYPSHIVAPVSDTALQPTRANSTKNVDFFDEGTIVTLSVRYLDGNNAIRSLSQACGVPCIDAELGWIRALTDTRIATGSMVGAENSLFNPGQFNHPNLTGIRYSYHAGNASFAAALSRQTMQGGAAPVLNGRFALNLPQNVGLPLNNPSPLAVLDVTPEYGDVASSPLIIRTNSGPLDGAGTKSAVKKWEIDPLTGNFVSDSVILGASIGMPGMRARDHLGRIEVRDRLTFYNLPAGSTLATYALPADMGGSFSLTAMQNGVAVSQRYRIEFTTHDGVVTLEPGYPSEIAPFISFTVAISGLTVVATIKYSGTNMHLTCDAW